MRVKLILFSGVLFALLFPFIYNIAISATGHSGMIAESSIFSLDKTRYFTDLAMGHSVFNAGQYSIFPLNYFIWYSLWNSLDRFLPDNISYFVLVCLFYAMAFYYLTLLLIKLIGQDIKTCSLSAFAVANIVALLYLSALGNFNFIKSNIFFVVPYLVLAPLIYWALTYIETNSNRYLLPFATLALMLADFNLAHAILLAIFINVTLLVLRHRTELPTRTFALRMMLLNLALVPAFCFLFALVLDNALYYGSVSTFTSVAFENMYSNNATYRNIFLQLTDWGLFGAWNGKPYYDFASFYADQRVAIFGFAPFILLGYGLLVSDNARARRLSAALLLFCLALFQLMLGNNNLIYRFIYEHIVFFQVFRNITKIGPLMFFVLLIASYILVAGRLSIQKHRLVVLSLLVAALFYNLPFWGYSGYFFRDRSIPEIPQYWRNAADYLNTTTPSGSKILALPAIYINDVYLWNKREAWVQGSLLDVLIRNKSFRLSECCLGSADYQADARGTFVPSAFSVRHLDTDYGALTKLVKKYHLDYVVVTSDILSEYENLNDIDRWLRVAGYRNVANFGPISIYRNPKNYIDTFSGATVASAQLNFLAYDLQIRGLRRNGRVRFEQPYHGGWQLFFEPYDQFAACRAARPDSKERCSTSRATLLDETRYVAQNSPLAKVHRPGTGDSNVWFLSRALVERNGRGFYRHNRDGSLDVAFKLYFRPQAQFYLSVGAALSIFIAFFTFLILQSAFRHSFGLQISIAIASAYLLGAAYLYSGPLSATRSQALPAARTGNTPSRISSQATSGDHLLSQKVRVVFPLRSRATSTISYDLPAGGRSGASNRWKFSQCQNVAAVAEDHASSRTHAVLKLTALAPGTCTFTVSATDPNIAPATTYVTVMGPLSWNAGAQTKTSTVVFESTAAAPKVLTAYKTFDNEPLELNLVGAAECAPHLEMTPQAPFTPAIPSGVPASTPLLLLPSRPGSCTARIKDQYSAQGDRSLILNAVIKGDLSLGRTSLVSSTSLTFASPRDARQTIVLFKPYESERIVPVFSYNGCDRVAGFYPKRAFTPKTPSLTVPASLELVVKPASPGTCTTVLTDQYAADERPVSITITVLNAAPKL